MEVMGIPQMPFLYAVDHAQPMSNCRSLGAARLPSSRTLPPCGQEEETINHLLISCFRPAVLVCFHASFWCCSSLQTMDTTFDGWSNATNLVIASIKQGLNSQPGYHYQSLEYLDSYKKLVFSMALNLIFNPRTKG